MPAPRFIHFHKPEIEGVKKQPDPAQVVSGNPEQTSWLYSDIAATGTRSGQWDCQAGSFNCDYTGIMEFCQILEGEASVTDLDSGTVHDLASGDAFVMEPGLRTRWDVPRYVRKHFVITDVR
jgi:uncharacterized cupin superfamily protein